MDYEAVEQLLNTMPCLTFCKDVETGRYIACNQSFAKTVCPGKSIDDVLGLSDIDLFDARTAAHFIADDKITMCMDTPHVILDTLPLANGDSLQLQTTKVKFIDRHGNPCLLGMAVDITETLKMREDMHATEQRYIAALAENNEIIANANMGVWHIFLFDGEKPRMRANATMRKLLHLPDNVVDEEEIYTAWYSRITPQAIKSVNASVAKMMTGVKDENTYLWDDPVLGEQYVRCGGTAHKVEGKGWILRGYHYNVNEEILRDKQHERELANALEAAQKANQAKTIFLNNMSHDIRTPMNAICGFTKASMKANKDPLIAGYLEKIDKSSEHLLSLINDVLDIARIESGSFRYTPEPVDLRVVVDDINSIAKGALDNRDLKFIDKRVLVCPFVKADALRIREVVVNLLSNAIKFTNDGGTITFITDMPPCADENYVRVRFTVSDTGIGMSPEFVERIFDKFEQEDAGARTRYKGTGLGMSIVKKYVDLMGGTISVTSEKGKGTTVTVEIPLEKTACCDKPSKKGDADTVDLHGLNVLLVEDNELNAEIAQMLLEDMGMHVTLVENGQLALEAWKHRSAVGFDLILMDIMMPVMNGYEATKAIRSVGTKASLEIPIIAMSANAFSEDIQASHDAGMNAHIIKPVRADEIRRTIARCLQSGDSIRRRSVDK